jgi:hypothetical protein
VATGGPYEYLQWSQAEHLSSLVLFSKVQNLQDQLMYFAFAILGFAVPQTSQIGAKDCRSSSFSIVVLERKHINNYKYDVEKMKA